MELRQGGDFATLTPEMLLGPLNDVEQKYAPSKLFVAGPMEIALPSPRASIVGSRKASKKGLEAARELARFLVSKGTIIVSGLAEGIDTAAHASAMSNGGRTIAVIATPLDKCYPAQNAKLQEEIRRRHLLISQFEIGKRVFKQNFILRNRTMALISNATIIVEAKDDSGSLHQGWEALRLGRSLFIWRDVLDDRSVKVPQDMLKYGAIRLEEPEEILPSLPQSESLLEIAQ
ncbi:MAG: DNA-protecting protein DprA [Nitrososphaerota archaeon]|nr:DNA-protecting protein DprA [Nitrososphaerota archaeon]